MNARFWLGENPEKPGARRSDIALAPARRVEGRPSLGARTEALARSGHRQGQARPGDQRMMKEWGRGRRPEVSVRTVGGYAQKHAQPKPRLAEGLRSRVSQVIEKRLQ